MPEGMPTKSGVCTSIVNGVTNVISINQINEIDQEMLGVTNS